MGWFNKKEKKGKKREETPQTLPELPKLPEFPKKKRGKIDSIKEVSKLPSFPTNSLGEKFSQSTIKEAITGEKEGEGVFKTDDFAIRDEMRMMQKPLRKPLTKELYPLEERKIPSARKIPREFKEGARIKEVEPVFIRIDKFEESLDLIEKTKSQILEIENMLKDVVKIKEEEEKELNFWRGEIQTIKKQVEKIDENIFSKIE